MIDKWVELDFDGLPMAGSDINFNQANRNSIRFNYIIRKGSNLINYSDYTRAEVAFQKKDGIPIVDDAKLTASGISYILRDEIFDLSGVVTGQVNLYTDDSLSATLLYNFRIIPDQANIDRASRIYIGRVEQLVAEINDDAAEIRRILEDIQSDSFATEEFVINKTNAVSSRVEANTSDIANLVSNFDEVSSDIDNIIEQITSIATSPLEWQAPVFQSGFSGASTLSYAKDLKTGIVYIVGYCVPPATIAGSEIIFVLKQGYRPSRPIIFPSISYNNIAFKLQVDTSGNVTIRLPIPSTAITTWFSVYAIFKGEL